MSRTSGPSRKSAASRNSIPRNLGRGPKGFRPSASCPYSPECVEGSNVLREEGAGLAMGHVKASANASVKP
jgi:hypothetical protein